MKDLIKKIMCLFLLHKWKSLFKDNKNKYKIVCSRCGKGNKDKWKDNTEYIIIVNK